MIIKESNSGRIILVRLGTGDDILHSLISVAEEKKIKSGLILAGVGSVSKYHYHVAKTYTFPIENEYTKGQKALDIVCIQGVIMDKRVHAHITLSDIDSVIGGHMEEGCVVLSFSVITIMEVPEADLNNWDAIGQLE
jgi:predicted DNA-binding protein with PD1-like motif